MRRACMTILMVLMTVLLPVAAGAVEAPHNFDTSASPPRNFTCAQCHLGGRSYGLKKLENLCFQCHQYSSNVDYPVSGADSSNVFRTVTTSAYKNLSEANKKMTSHNWVGPDSNAAAGAVAPTTGPLYKAAVNYTVSCARCHYVHSSGTLYQQSKPLLRMANDQDQMCFECHKPRNTRLSSDGTHPVTYNYYSSFNIRGASWMKAAPENVNPGNPSSDLSRYLKKNRVVCSTCHKLHKADSNSASYDSYTSTMQPPSTMRKGKGMLLRTDFVRPDGTTANICQNCHAYGNHNKKASSNMQCTYCHSAHVTTDLAGNLIPGNPNLLLVNRYMNYSAISIAGGNVRTIPVFRQTTSNADLYRTDKKGVCQVCHPSSMSSMGVAAGHLIGGVLDPAYAKCNSCHPHNGTTSFTPNGAAACGACHGRPPRVNGPGNKRYAGWVDGGYAVYTSGTANNYSYNTAKNGVTNIVKDESLTPHWRHSAATYDVDPNNYGLACDECHKGNAHRSMNYQDVFLVPATNFPKTHPRPGDSITAPIAGFFAKNAVTYVSTNSTTGTCSNVYCHSNGGPRNATFNIYTGIVYKTIPLWPNGKNTISASAGNRCSACHDAQPATNSHTKHRNVNTGNAVMSATIGCNVCHKNTLSLTNYTTIDYAGNKHVNGLKEVAFSAPYDAVPMTWTLASGTCSNACHANGVGTGYGTGVAATWGTTASSRCGVCHAFPPATGAHAKHMPSSASLLHQSYTSVGVWSTSGEYIFGCANCHPKNVANHINGTVEVTLNKNHGGLLKSKNTNANDDTSGWSKAAGKLYCFASYCHSNGTNGVSAAFKFYSSPDWYGTFSGDKCAMCHGNSPNNGKTGSPAHYNTNSMGTGKVGGHFVGIHYNDIYSGGTGKASSTSAAGLKNHGESTYSTTINCTTCHSATVDITVHNYNDKNPVCVTCHYSGNSVGATFGHTDPSLKKNAHLNGAIDVSFDTIQVKSKAQLRQKSFDLYSLATLKRYPTATSYKVSGAYDQGDNALANGMWTAGTRTCANVSCHNGVSITWTTDMSVNTCSNCHNAL